MNRIRQSLLPLFFLLKVISRWESTPVSYTHLPYIVRMARLGQQTGTLDQMMKSLSDYYEKEARLLKAVKNAATYPAMMILMLLVDLFVIFTKVMPVFSRVYEQLGASLPPAAAAALRLGGILSGAALVLSLIHIL